METQQKTILSVVLSVIITTLFVGVIAFASWNEPGGNPPTGNAPEPINVGSSTQTKTGSLTVGDDFNANLMHSIAPGSNTFFGDVTVGTAGKTSNLTVNGTIETTSGGVKYPDGSVQTTTVPTSCYAWWGGKWKTVHGQNVYIRPVALIFDGAMDDYGPSASGDSLYMFCVSPDGGYYGQTGMCLTGEPCPWG